MDILIIIFIVRQRTLYPLRVYFIFNSLSILALTQTPFETAALSNLHVSVVTGRRLQGVLNASLNVIFGLSDISAFVTEFMRTVM